GSSTYQMRYEVMGGNAVVRDNSGSIIQSGTYYNVTEGNYNWSLLASDVGNVRLRFYVRNASNTERNVDISISVEEIDFNIQLYPNEIEQDINVEVPIILEITQTSGITSNYTGIFSSNNTGRIIFNGVTYNPGSVIPNLILGNNNLSYIGTNVGQHNVSFSVTNTNNNITANDSFIIDF